MFARISRFQLESPDRIDDLAASYRQDALPALSQIAGYRGAALLADRATGVGHSISYWDSEASMQASEEAGAALRAQATQRGTQIVDVDHAEIVIQERTSSPRAGTFVRVNELTATPSSIDSLIEYIRGLIPTVSAQHGYRAMIMGVNRQSGRVTVSSVWDTAADREASDPSMSERRRDAAQLAGAENVSIQLLEALVVEIKMPAPAG